MTDKLTTEQQLAKRYSDQLQQLVEHRKKTIAEIDSQIRLLQGAMLGLNELMEMNRAAVIPPPPAMVMSGDEEVEGDAKETEETPQS